MATKSFLKNINIKSYDQAKNLAEALERAERHTGKEVILKHSVTEVRGDKAKDFIMRCGESAL
ncbi:MAG: hypothetical protein J6O04_06945 [Selenomonadaceae bacterium]|nr:hypothetical protein [Selenomonadaceae bacterium]